MVQFTFLLAHPTGLSPVRPTRWTVHRTLHFCFAKTLLFVRGSIFKSIYSYQLNIQKIDPTKPKGSARTDLVRIKGLASFEPPAKQSTGLFFRLTANTQPKGCSLLIQIPYSLCHTQYNKIKATLLDCLYFIGCTAGEPAEP